MNIVVFGLTISSSWGNGHATLLRGLFRQLVRRGHRIVFFERNVPYYAAHRDAVEFPGVELHLYEDWTTVLPIAKAALAGADTAIVTSYCPDGIAASELFLCSASCLRVFYDLDTPITLEKIGQGQPLTYIGPRGLADFDLVLSYTGGEALTGLQSRLGARRVAPLYGSVDPDFHAPAGSLSAYYADLSYLGTYAADRQHALELLFLEPARRLKDRRFIIGGSKYPVDFPWLPNVWYVRHVPPPRHPAFYCSSLMTLNVTRSAMAQMGYCPSGRLFEAAACGTAIISDRWQGLEQFFQPGTEILVADTANDVIEALELPNTTIAKIAKAARERALDSHTARHRALELEELLESAAHRPQVDPHAQNHSRVSVMEA